MNPEQKTLLERRRRLALRALKCDASLKEVAAVDPGESSCARDSNILTNIAIELTKTCDAGFLRLDTVLSLLEAILDIQDTLILERKAELARHARQ